MGGDVYTVTSGKGGVGKTTTAVNLAVGLRQRGHRVALVDADVGMPNVAGVLAVEPSVTLHDVLAGDADVDEAVLEPAEGLGIVAGDRSLEGFVDADPDELEGVVAELAGRYQFVVVDTGGGLSYEGVLPLELADGAILVTTDEEAAVGDTEKSAALAGRVDVPVGGVVVTKATAATDAAAVAERLDTSLLATVPRDETVVETISKGKPIVTYAPKSDAGAAYGELAATVGGDADASLDPLVTPGRAAVDDGDDRAEGGQSPEPDDDRDGPDAPAEEATDDEVADEARTDGEGPGGRADGEPDEGDDERAERSGSDANRESAESEEETASGGGVLARLTGRFR